MPLPSILIWKGLAIALLFYLSDSILLFMVLTQADISLKVLRDNNISLDFLQADYQVTISSDSVHANCSSYYGWLRQQNEA